MWRISIVVLIVTAGLIIGIIGSCASDSSDSTSTSTGEDGFMYSSTKEVAPIIVEDQSASSMRNLANSGPYATIDTSGLPTVVQNIYSLIKNYDKDLPHAGQGVNMENLFRVLAAAEDWYDGGYDNCSSITKRAISAPYQLFDTDREYDCAINLIGDNEASYGDDISNETYAQGLAFDKSDSNIIKGLFGYRWSPTFATDGHFEHGVVEGSYNESTNDLTLANVHLVNYDSADQSYGGFAVRTFVEGNVATHAFTFSTINIGVHRAGDTAGGSWEYNSGSGYTAVVGKGYSKAETAGTPKYLLFKATQTGASPVYYCLEVGVEGIEESTISALDSSGHTIDSNSNCNQFKTDVDDLYNNGLLGPTDLPYVLDGTGAEGFNSSTVFLNYN
jgi:hypothetical protein